MDAREGGLCGQRALGKSVPVDARHRQPRYERITARKHSLVRSGRYPQRWGWVQGLLEAAASRKRNAQTKIQLSRWSCPPGTTTGGVSCKHPLPLAKRRSSSFLCFLVVFFLFTELATTHAGNLCTRAQKVKSPMVMTPHTCRLF